MSIFLAIETFAVGVVLSLLVRALHNQIKSLNGVVKAQGKTLEVMEQRADEAFKIVGMQGGFLADLPGQMKKYKETIDIVKEAEIQKIKVEKDGEAKKASEAHLKQIQVLEQLLDERNTALKRLEATQVKVRNKLDEILSTGPPRSDLFANLGKLDFTAVSSTSDGLLKLGPLTPSTNNPPRRGLLDPSPTKAPPPREHPTTK